MSRKLPLCLQVHCHIWFGIKYHSPSIVPHTLRRPSPSARLQARPSVGAAQLCPDQTKETGLIALESPYRSDGDKPLVGNFRYRVGSCRNWPESAVDEIPSVGRKFSTSPLHFHEGFMSPGTRFGYAKSEYCCWNERFGILALPIYISHSLSELVPGYLFSPVGLVEIVVLFVEDRSWEIEAMLFQIYVLQFNL